MDVDSLAVDNGPAASSPPVSGLGSDGRGMGIDP